jgi:carbamoyltransferase
MRVLGLSAFYHDSAAALVEDGRIVAAAGGAIHAAQA